MKLTLLPWVLVLGLAAGLAAVYSGNRKQTAALEQLRSENAQIQANAEEAKQSQAQSENTELARLRKENEEILKLRNEVRQLRDEKQQLSKQVQSAQSQAATAQAQVQNIQAQARTVQAQPNPGGPGFQPTAPSEVEKMNACVNNLRMIDAAKQQWALENKKPVNTLVSSADITSHFKDRVMPACPAGGAYSVNPVGVSPTCSVPGHALPKAQ